eukprot:gene5592-6960_t
MNTYTFRLLNRGLSTTTTTKFEGRGPVDLEFNTVHPTTRAISDGPKKSAIILHGLFGAGVNWRSISPKIANSIHQDIIQIDLRNHGSSPHTQEFDIELMAKDLDLFIEKHTERDEKITLIGHSLGGRVSMKYTLTHPDKVDKLVVVDVSPTKFKAMAIDEFTRYLKVMNSMDMSKIKTRKQAEEMFMEVCPNQIVRQFLLTNLISNPDFPTIDKDIQYKWRINVETMLKDIDNIRYFDYDSTDVYTGDTLFLGGGDSPYIKEEDHPLIKKLFPNSHITIIPNTGHWLHYEDPVIFTKLVSQFINTSKVDDKFSK